MKRVGAAIVLSFALSATGTMPGALAQSRVLKAKPARAAAPTIATSPALQAVVDAAAQEALKKFADKTLKPEHLAVTVIDMSDPARFAEASYRGDERIYPASVVKMFYLVAAHRLLEDGRIKETPELNRALRDMIVDSSNDATGYVLDVLTGTTSGGELSSAELKRWQSKRDLVNRYFAGLGYRNININQKTFCEDAYGREQQSRGTKGENRNKLTTSATARLLAEIAAGRAVTPERSRQMLELMKRDFAGKSNDPDDQSHGFTGIALAPGMRLWSKAGWTSTTRHDAAYVELPNNRRFVVVTFTEKQSGVRDIIPTVARAVITEMMKGVSSKQ
ncbi:MAG: serine hydrolase [Pyrinomonadaceae bacterium]